MFILKKKNQIAVSDDESSLPVCRKERVAMFTYITDVSK